MMLGEGFNGAAFLECVKDQTSYILRQTSEELKGIFPFGPMTPYDVAAHVG